MINPPYAASEPPRIPMGLLYIGAVLEEAGHQVKVLDLLVSKPAPKRIRNTIEEFDPQVVGSTSVTMNYPATSSILKFVKEINPEITTIVGGPHVTFCWEEIGKTEPWIDIVVLGEGEKTVWELTAVLENNADLSQVVGIAWRNGKDNGFINNGNRSFISNLDSLPMPARHLFPLSRYRLLRMDAGLSTGRGCPFSCIFCVGPKMVGRKPRVRSPQKVVDELEEVMKMGFESIAFSDDHFAMNRKHAFAVCDEIIARGLKPVLNIFVRADSVDEEILAKMYEAGCRKVLFGVESGVQKIVDTAKKKQDLQMVKEKIALTKSMGIDVQASFILGLPGESPATIERTFEYAKSLKTFFGMHILAPLPGSEISERAEDFGLTIHHRNWERYDANRAVASTKTLSAEELNKIAEHYDAIFEKLAQWDMDAYRKGLLSTSDRERIERRRAQAFFWKVLRENIIEDFVPREDYKNPSHALNGLADIAGKHTGFEAEESYMCLKSAFDDGEIEWKDGRFVISSAVYPKQKTPR